MGLVDIGILVLVAIGLFFAGKRTIKSFKGEETCCSSNGISKDMLNKKLDKVIGSETLIIDGMHCQHCADKVASELNKIDGVSAKVDLKNKQATVSYDRAIDDAKIKKAIDIAGYTLVSVNK